MALLKPIAKSKTRTLSLRMPSPLLDELDAVRQKADAAGLTLDVGEIVQRALQAAVRTAQAELSATSAKVVTK